MKLVGTKIFFLKRGLSFRNKENNVQKDVSCLFYIEECLSLAAVFMGVECGWKKAGERMTRTRYGDSH